jgi:hypothetical protein
MATPIMPTHTSCRAVFERAPLARSRQFFHAYYCVHRMHLFGMNPYFLGDHVKRVHVAILGNDMPGGSAARAWRLRLHNFLHHLHTHTRSLGRAYYCVRAPNESIRLGFRQTTLLGDARPAKFLQPLHTHTRSLGRAYYCVLRMKI